MGPPPRAAAAAGEGEPPEPPFAHGMCRACYVEFLQVAGSSDDAAANPPAFTRGVQKELAAQQAEVQSKSRCRPRSEEAAAKRMEPSKCQVHKLVELP